MKNKSLAVRRNPISITEAIGTSPSTLIIGIALVGLLIWFLVRKQPIRGTQLPAGTYSNKEEWDVEYNSDGLPTKITIHRDAVRR